MTTEDDPFAQPSANMDETPGPWEADRYSGYGSHYWAVSRRNPKVLGYREILRTKGWNPRSFKSQEAAQKVADKLNAAAQPRQAR